MARFESDHRPPENGEGVPRRRFLQPPRDRNLPSRRMPNTSSGDPWPFPRVGPLGVTRLEGSYWLNATPLKLATPTELEVATGVRSP